MILDHLMAVLSTIFELSMYGHNLQSSPAIEAALLVEDVDTEEMKQAQARVMEECRLQWTTVLTMENQTVSNELLLKMCPHTRFIGFRETLTALEASKWTLDPDTAALLRAWHPALAHSANVEQIFSSIEDSCKRSNKNARSSLSNLQCLCIRATEQKLTGNEPNRPKNVSLTPADYEGSDIRNVKAHVWRPESYSGSNSGMKITIFN